MSTQGISRQLSEIDDQVSLLNVQIDQLKYQRQNLLERKNQLEKALRHRSELPAGGNLSWEGENFGWSEQLKLILKKTFKIELFRDGQLAAINAILAGDDVILVMSTGGGKSLCYQLPALLNDGFTLVISPLVSLMQDQMMALKRFGISGSMLCQSTAKAEHSAILNSMVDTHSPMKLLFVTPEKLAKSKRFMSKLEKSYSDGRLQRIAIDEIHCCSQWGHDFRPDYKFLNILRRQFPKNVPILGLTATATSSVIDDVTDILNIPAALIFRAPFNRPNLRYEVVEKPAKAEDFLNLLVNTLNDRFKGQSGIVYCFSRKQTEELADFFSSRGLKAECYHADLTPDRRARVHDRWQEGSCRIIVATVAFGMGIDKSDVRFVVHHTMAKSLENYYQESGRAGRDGSSAVCLLFYGFSDIFRQTSMICTEKMGLQNLYGMVKFCLRSDQCRRKVLAGHFGEKYEPNWCDKKCDFCSNSIENGKKHAYEKNGLDGKLKACLSQVFVDNKTSKMTGPKLAEILSKILKTPRPLCEHFIANQLLSDGLKQEFHFTPYSIVCYVTPGERWCDSDDVIDFHDVTNGSDQSSSKIRKRKHHRELDDQICID